MILVSFSSWEDALSNDIKIYHTFSSQGTEKSAVPLFLGTPGIGKLDMWNLYCWEKALKLYMVIACQHWYFIST